MLMLFMVAVLAGRGFEAVDAEMKEQAEQRDRPVVVIDAGHGGVDPGKVGVNQALEKDINLKIAEKLKVFLEAADVEVILTREGDSGLYKETDGNKKIADMKARCQVIEKSGADIVVSVHQNSYHEGSVRGPQVFYYTHSEEGKELAEAVQDGFSGLLGEQNTRPAKGNTDYYLFLHVKQPIVIVECGFLSNREEAENLTDETYQEKVAWVIHLGVLKYLNAG
ncbi:MAG: N-acetylmuramoyl-L-alanine amidase [Lachnospiraceae bacterium]|nr:N-acetylmuramoyl-L-alanine amidase [Lachnospiraceae bacterium]